MNRCCHLLPLIAAAYLPTAFAAAPDALATDPLRAVNPFIGTTNGGNVFPGATVPFGMVQFSPEAIETPWLYNFLGQPWKTQQLVRQVLNTIWPDAPNGIPGNDDLGEMSSWAVFASMGFYPEIPGRAELVLGSPLFPEIRIHRRAGDILIHAPAASAQTPYIQSLTVNGKPYTATYLPESFTLKGGTLDFKLGGTPNQSWGTGAKDRPPSFDVQ